MNDPKRQGFRSSEADGGSSERTIDLWSLVRRQSTLLIWCLFGSWVAAAAFYLLSPPLYESKAHLLVMRKDPRLPTQGVGRASESDARISDELLATQMQIIKSRRIVQLAVEREGLGSLASIQTEVGEDGSAVRYLIENLQVTRGAEGPAREAHVLNITFQHGSAEDAKKVLSAIIAEYRQYLRDNFQDVNKDAAQLIAAARDTLEGELKDAEADYRAHREAAPILGNAPGSKNVHRQRFEDLHHELSRLSIQISAAEVRLAVVTESIAEQEAAGASDLQRLALIDEDNAQRVRIMLDVERGDSNRGSALALQPERVQNVRSEYQELLSLLMKEQSLVKELGNRHPQVVNIRSQIDLANDFIGERGTQIDFAEESAVTVDDVTNAYLDLLRNDLGELKRRQAELTAMAEIEEEAARKLIRSELDGESLRQRIAHYQGLYDVVVERLRDINLAQEYGGVINDVLGAPEVGRKVWPSAVMCLGLGTLLGFFVGGSAAVVREVSDCCFRSPGDIRAATGVPLLAHIPHLPALSRSSDGSRKSTRLGQAVWSVHRPNSLESEAVRGLRTSLFAHAKKWQQQEQTIAITSPSVGDGKTTVAANLAVSIARAGGRVLIVDCDMRNPSVHTMFGITNDFGLTSLMRNEDGVEPWDVVRQTEVENLWALASGPVTGNPAELLASAEFENWLEVARQHYDYLILDCPPVLPVADASIVAGLADCVALVVRVSKGNRPTTLRARQMLAEVNANLVGTVINGYQASKGWSTGVYEFSGLQLDQQRARNSYDNETDVQRS